MLDCTGPSGTPRLMSSVTVTLRGYLVPSFVKIPLRRLLMRTGQTFLARERCIKSSPLFSPILLGAKGSCAEIHSSFQILPSLEIRDPGV